MFSCIIDIEPKPAPRPRVTKTGHVYMDNWYKDYLEDIRYQVNKYLHNYCTHDPINLTVKFYKDIPIKQKRYGDLDNLVKGVMDALIGYAYYDDAQIIKIQAEKYKSSTAKIEIWIEFLEE